MTLGDSQGDSLTFISNMFSGWSDLGGFICLEVVLMVFFGLSNAFSELHGVSVA